jgi:hypothetical protein
LTTAPSSLPTNSQFFRLWKAPHKRKNWLFAWEDLGGERTAHILTIVGTCVAHGINPRAYLHLVINLIVNRWPQAKLCDLLPDRVAISHPDLLVRDGSVRSLLLGLESPPSPRY